jgi:hypothetical protein
MLEYQPHEGGVIEPQRVLPVESEYDVVVVGGGIAGVGAAIAAARGGCRTLVVEQTSALGGLATMGLVNIPLDYRSGIGEEMIRELEAVDGHWHRNSDPEKHKLVLDRMVQASGCDILFVTTVVDSLMRGDAICGVVVESKSGRQAIMARRVIDCSGDADAACYAGCEYSVGRASDGYVQGCSLEFRLGGVDWDAYQNSECKAQDPRWEALIEQALEAGDLPYPIDNHLNWMTHVPGRPEHCGMDEVSICFAHSRYCKPLSHRDLTRMYLEGRDQCDILWKFIRKWVPGFERCWLVDTAPLLGVRDSRRILGEYTLTGFDVARRAKFDDVIAITWRGFDVHNPTGPGNQKWFETVIDGETRYIVAGLDGYGSSSFPPGGPAAFSDYLGRTGDELQDERQKTHYDVPYRCLVPQKVDNLLVAGRCLSADFPGQSATRLVMCCNAMGEAAGHATVLSLQHDIPPRQVDRVELQRRLLAAGCTLGERERTIPGVTD